MIISIRSFQLLFGHLNNVKFMLTLENLVFVSYARKMES